MKRPTDVNWAVAGMPKGAAGGDLVDPLVMGEVLQAESQMFDDAIRALLAIGYSTRDMRIVNWQAFPLSRGLQLSDAVDGVQPDSGIVFRTDVEIEYRTDVAAEEIARDADLEGRHEEAMTIRLDNPVMPVTVTGRWLRWPVR